MRTTISLDKRLARQLRRRAKEAGLSVSAFIEKVLDDHLKARGEPVAHPFKLVAVGEGGVRPGFDLNRPQGLQVAEDEAIYRRESLMGF